MTLKEIAEKHGVSLEVVKMYATSVFKPTRKRVSDTVSQVIQSLLDMQARGERPEDME